MSGQHTVTYEATATADRPAAARDTWVGTGRAARELGLKPTEFDLAVQLGRVRTTTGGGGGRRVARAEIERLRAGPGFPESLHRSVRAVGTTEGAALIGVTKTRFTRLARLGLLVPVKYYLNRYRAVVWLYLAEELSLFTTDGENVPLLTGRTPESLRSQLDTGIDLRPRNWRTRQLGFLLRQADGPWERAGAVASLLDPQHVSEAVQDACDRSHLNRFRRPPPSHGAPGSPAADLAEELMTAQDPDEIAWLQTDLRRLTHEARTRRPAPRPTPHHPAPAHPAPPAVEPARETPRGLFARWWRGSR
ncbi:MULTISPECIES: DUF6397 family protein [Streptomyces]|uniref:DUF6397 family protein n=1 Tax=Streptomyces edwardsiae TaxID=3075527 RepID=A0ABU2PNF0_9ACTN|nr:DUF6397 family protein [Streptomyces sp. DSM 41636]MDT0393352.1 DUF6397 family protein [Streptomyces sp. DSM 41636]